MSSRFHISTTIGIAFSFATITFAVAVDVGVTTTITTTATTTTTPPPPPPPGGAHSLFYTTRLMRKPNGGGFLRGGGAPPPTLEVSRLYEENKGLLRSWHHHLVTDANHAR